MIKLVLIVGFLAAALYWLVSAPPSASSPGDGPAQVSELSPPSPSSSQIQAIQRRREIFCAMVEEVKSGLSAEASQREKNLFDLAPSPRKWEVLRSYMVERGSPDGPQLLSILAVASLEDIEFGTLDGSSRCSVPQEAGFVLRRPAR